MEEASAFEEIEGMGVKGNVGGTEVIIGNCRLMNKFGIGLSSSLEKRAFFSESRGMTVVFFGWGGQVHGLLVFRDSLKRGVPDLVRELQTRKIFTWLKGTLVQMQIIIDNGVGYTGKGDVGSNANYY